MLVFTSRIQKKTITVIWRKIDKKNLSKEKLKIKTTSLARNTRSARFFAQRSVQI